jgi:hypothetical protein
VKQEVLALRCLDFSLFRSIFIFISISISMSIPSPQLIFHHPTGIFQRLQQGDLPDGVAGAQANPLGDGPVLALGFGNLLLGAEGLVALDGDWISVLAMVSCNTIMTYRHLEGGRDGELVDGEEVVGSSAGLCAAGAWLA